jgi:hypothetical protein
MYRLFETTLAEGDEVELLGETSREMVPGAAGPRDVFLEVMRGRPGRPVVVSITARANPRPRLDPVPEAFAFDAPGA